MEKIWEIEQIQKVKGKKALVLWKGYK